MQTRLGHSRKDTNTIKRKKKKKEEERIPDMPQTRVAKLQLIKKNQVK